MSNATNSTNTSTRRPKQKKKRQNLMVIGQSELKTEENNMENLRVLTLTSKNIAK